MPAKQTAKKTRSGADWQVRAVGYSNLSIAPDGDVTGTVTPAPIDDLLDCLAKFANAAGTKLNKVDICPSEVTIEGNVSLDVGGGVLLFGVSAGISVSMTWKFDEAWTTTIPRGGKRGLTADPRLED